MLYERWRKIAAEWHGQPALRDTASGRRWTFAELFAAGESWQGAPALAAPKLPSEGWSGPASVSGIIFPQGHSPEFILGLLAAWRENKIICPLEPGQTLPQVPIPPVDCVHLKCTSATTGAARVIAFTAEQLAADAENIVATMGLRPDWPNLGAISMAHSYGFSNLVLPLLLHGVPLIIAPSPLPEAVRHAAKGEPALTLAGVPALWRAWHEANAIPPNVRLAISAGAPLPLALEQAVFQMRGVKIHNFLGSSECGGIAYDSAETPRTDDACVGAPMRNVELTLNADGCLQVHGRAVGETYWPDAADTLGSGRFQTSDLAELKDGFVFLRGRAGDLINVAGRKVSPETIERALAAHPQIRECLVFGAPSRDVERTEIIVAVVAGNATDSELKHFLQPRLPAWQVPREWWFVASLSANLRGKVSRVEWKRKFLELRANIN
ncbi:MAG: class I adenylate-forming enzyme family protein [Verrucomicrobiota bacterium]|jgi:acyl-coenzyme A synthetase/AMP-(fatty) acid ligase